MSGDNSQEAGARFIARYHFKALLPSLLLIAMFVVLSMSPVRRLAQSDAVTTGIMDWLSSNALDVASVVISAFVILISLKNLALFLWSWLAYRNEIYRVSSDGVFAAPLHTPLIPWSSIASARVGTLNGRVGLILTLKTPANDTRRPPFFLRGWLDIDPARPHDIRLGIPVYGQSAGDLCAVVSRYVPIPFEGDDGALRDYARRGGAASPLPPQDLAVRVGLGTTLVPVALAAIPLAMGVGLFILILPLADILLKPENPSPELFWILITPIFIVPATLFGGVAISLLSSSWTLARDGRALFAVSSQGLRTKKTKGLIAWSDVETVKLGKHHWEDSIVLTIAPGAVKFRRQFFWVDTIALIVQPKKRIVILGAKGTDAGFNKILSAVASHKAISFA